MLGYCCICWQLRHGPTPIFTNRSCVQRNFTKDLAGRLALQNVRDLRKILEWNEATGIKVFRVSSHMFPHATNPGLSYLPSTLPTGDLIVAELRSVGRYAEKCGHVLSLHPPHFVSLASDRADVAERSIEELEHHCWIADRLCDEAPGLTVNLNWHVGRGFDHRHVPVFLNMWQRLSPSCQRRSTLENDDERRGWSVPRIHRYLWPETGCRITFDLHHWNFCHEQGAEAEFRLAKSTWQGRWQECHVSNSRNPFEREITHSDYLYEDIPEYILEEPKVYIHVEAGAKEYAVLRYAKEHGILLSSSTTLRLP
jgi:UV DNA damage endonuclease